MGLAFALFAQALELLLEKFAAELLKLTSVGKKFRISALCDCLALLSADNYSLEHFLKIELKSLMKGDEGDSAAQVAKILASILTKDSALLEDDFELLGAASQLVQSTFSTASPDWFQIGTVANFLCTMADDGLANSVASDIERCFLLPLPLSEHAQACEIHNAQCVPGNASWVAWIAYLHPDAVSSMRLAAGVCVSQAALEGLLKDMVPRAIP